jgi:hypothetical protein
MRDNNRAVLDDAGAPVEIIVPVEQICDEDGDDREYCGGFDIRLPIEAIRYPHRVKVDGAVHEAGSHNSLARDDTSAKYSPPVVVVQPPVVVERPVVVEPTVVVEERPIVLRRQVVVHRRPVVVVERPVRNRVIIERRPGRVIRTRD